MKQRRSFWVLDIGSIAKIPIRVHLTFLLLLVWLTMGGATSAEPNTSPLREGGFVIVVFACILAHELGHALVARAFGVKTRDITLYPFGGIATLMSQPAPKAEFLIAIAGPLVNVAIAFTLIPWVTFPVLPDETTARLPTESLNPGDFSILTRVCITNFGLALFNLIPALPMDGGRVLRALLAIFKVRHPTKIAARVSQGICIALGLAAVYFDLPMLFVIAFIIFFGAIQEYISAESKAVAVAFTVRDAMIPRERLETFTHATTVAQAMKVVLTSLQPLYPVIVGENVIGVVFREDILHHAATEPDEYISSIVTREVPTVLPDQPLTDVLSVIQTTGIPVVLVMRDETFLGILVQERLAEFLVLSSIPERHKHDDDTEWSTPL